MGWHLVEGRTRSASEYCQLAVGVTSNHVPLRCSCLAPATRTQISKLRLRLLFLYSIRALQMIREYLLWIATWPILTLYWLLPSEDNVLWRPLRNLAPSWRAPFRVRDLKSPPNREQHRTGTRPRPQGSTNIGDQAKQDDRSHSTNSTAAVISKDARSVCLAHVLEIVPDVKPDHVTRLIEIALPKYGQDEVLGRVLHTLFEKPNYPKVNISKNVKRADGQNDRVTTGSSSKTKYDFGYGNISRPFTGGADYTQLALVRCLVCLRYR